ncbi:MAG: gamma-glutamylcyclotransferase [Gammaproteobacteria bacterium]|nr:gamma-glutamylcyclotransferase [Gammaproteobacteria bacterium]MDH5653951.1 gamma-glutamylcyclotransferase [Gammaproteobacteria bacterium]
MTGHLFVYGTLLSGLHHPMHDLMVQHARFVAPGYINGRLYEIDNYPGLVLSNNPRMIVRGEIYAVADAARLFEYLDQYEGCSTHSARPYEYQRDMVTIHDSHGDTLLAWCYLYKRCIKQAKLIPVGDYLAFRNKGLRRIVNG